MRILLYVLLAMLWPVSNAYCQYPAGESRPLNIGDTIPSDIELTNLFNYPVSKIQLSNLKGKLVILDFWSTWCSICIEAFPKMQLLQQQFGDAIQIILVNNYDGDTPEKVKGLFNRREKQGKSKMNLPFSLQQASLNAYFPHKFVPHYAWISPAGQLVATTSLTEVTAENIQKLLAGDNLNLHIKKDILDFKENIPLGVNDNGMKNGDFLYRSMLTGYQEGIGNASGFQRNAAGLITRFYLFNTSALMLLKVAYPVPFAQPPNRIRWNLNKRDLFVDGATNDSLLYKNAFCYDLVIPPSSIEQVQGYVRSDVFRFWGVRVIDSTQMTPCLVLRLSDSSRSIPAGNSTVRALLHSLGAMPAFKDIPVVDETGIAGNIQLDLPADFRRFSRQQAIRTLRKKGLDLSPSIRPVTFFTITDKK